MTRKDRDQLREAIGWLKPGQSVEVTARDLTALLDDIDRIDAELQAFRQNALLMMAHCPRCDGPLDALTTFCCPACDADDAA